MLRLLGAIHFYRGEPCDALMRAAALSLSIRKTDLESAMTNSDRYDDVAIALHWSIAVLILAAFVLGLTVDVFPKSWTGALVNVHALMGLGVLVLSILRLSWRSSHPPPELPASMTPNERLGAKLVHGGLYVLMIAIPIIGIPTLLWRGRGLNFGFFEIASPFARSPEIYRPLTQVHEIAAYALIALVVGHMLAAIYHQFNRRDAILLRMLPLRGAPWK
jgi:cytochrome b561